MKCNICGKDFRISQTLGICIQCIRNRFEESKSFVEKAHAVGRKRMGLPTIPPKNAKGVECRFCGNECCIGRGEVGYCGLSKNVDGKLVRKIGTKDLGLGNAYKDWHVTNCVASWVCAGGTGAGYPRYAVKNGPETDFANASIFLGTCSYHCLYCQNTSWHDMIMSKVPTMKAKELAEWVLTDKSFTCVCWFGGDPCSQMPFVWNVSRLIRKEAQQDNRILRICLESDGNFAWNLLKKVAELSLESGGGLKFDLKCARGSKLSIALSGVSNEVSYRNFEKLIDLHQRRAEVPFLRVSTLLVPHYIDLEEVKKIVEFIAGLDTTIPFSLLAFHPHYLMTDMGFTSKSFAQKCYRIAKKAGLEKVRIGNVHLLR